MKGGSLKDVRTEISGKHSLNIAEIFFLGGWGGRVFLGSRSGGAPSGSPNLLHYFREYLCLDLQKDTSRIFSLQSHLRLVQYLMFLIQKKKPNKLQWTKKKHLHNAVYVITNLSMFVARVCVYIH